MLSYGEFLGPYEVIGMLGAGGMGQVYKARDTRLGRFVAVKVLRAETSQRADLRERLRNEAKSIARLNQIDNARMVLHRVRPEDRQNYHIRMAILMLSALEGSREEAEQGIDDELLRFAGANALRAFEAVELYSLLGRSAKALEWLDRTLRGGDERIDWFHRDPLLASIQNDARFTRMLASVERRRAQASTVRHKRTGHNS